jgi:hypothetical protein
MEFYCVFLLCLWHVQGKEIVFLFVFFTLKARASHRKALKTKFWKLCLGSVLVHPESQGIQQENFQDKILEIVFGFLFFSPESHDIQEGKLSRQTLGNCVWVLFLFALKAMTSKKESSQDKLWEIVFGFCSCSL